MRNLCFSMLAAVGAVSFTLQTLAAPPPQSASDEARLNNQPFVTSSVDEMASEFDGARESFLNIDGAAAALRIRRAIARMQEAAQDATEGGRTAINKSRHELELLAQAVEQRRVASVRSLDEAFARANDTLAQNHLLLAIRAQNQQARQRIGEELNSAIGHFQQGRQRLGQNLRQDEQELVTNTRRLAGNLIHGMGATADEIGQGIRSFGQRLEQAQAADSDSQTRQSATTGISR